VFLAGVDLAWTNHHPTGIAYGELKGSVLTVTDINHGVLCPDSICEELEHKHTSGVAIDAPTIINNQTGMRECEKAIGQAFGRKKASCMPSHLEKYPNHPAVELSQKLETQGFQHLLKTNKFQVECYPHPAIINLFGLPERLKYKKKKGMKVADQIHGQRRLGWLLRSLEGSPVLSLKIANYVQVTHFKFDQEYNLSGAALKTHEDKLDAIICLYVAALHAKSQTDIYGTRADGYIVVPKEQIYQGVAKDNEWEMAPWAVETAYKYYLAAVQTYSICGGVSMTNAALSIEIILKSYLLTPSVNLGALNQRYDRAKVSGDGHDLSNLLDRLPSCIQRKLVPSAFEREMLYKYRNYFKESRYAYETKAQSGHSGTLHSIAERMIRETVKIYLERGCGDPWIKNFS
jgi:predicted RNase H-like nuclease